eukprot:9893064-Ditylum_brightwellii.AAC.1
MEIAKDMLEELEKEGIKEVEDLAGFNKETWKQVVDNLKCLGGWMKNQDSRADKNHATVPKTLYLFSAKIQKKLLKASEMMKYYKTVGYL